jgi:hypothetical protein
MGLVPVPGRPCPTIFGDDAGETSGVRRSDHDRPG